MTLQQIIFEQYISYMINENVDSNDERERLFLECYKNMQSFLNDHSQENVKIMMKQNGIMNCFIEKNIYT